MTRHLEWIEWLHATLIFALLIPLACAVGDLPAPDGTAVFYVKCLFVAVPVAATQIAVRRAKTLGIYLLMCAALLAAVYAAVYGIPRLTGRYGFQGADVVYRIGMLVETAVIAAMRFMDRLRRIRYQSKREENPFELRAESFLNRPSMGFTWYFVVMYVLGILFDGKLLCDSALFGAVVYWLIALVYTFFGTTEHYFMLNKRTRGIPKRRLYAISGGMLCLFAGLVLAAVLPSFLLINARRYTDVREWFKDVPLVPSAYESDIEFRTPDSGMGGLPPMLLDELGEAPEPSKVWEVLFWVLGIAGAVVIVCGIVAAIKKLFEDFRKEADENGDKVENLPEPERAHFISAEPDGERSRIKRLYKRTIRKHRKDRPAQYEAPSEIEEKAGLSQDADMQALHTEYERVRYGR